MPDNTDDVRGGKPKLTPKQQYEARRAAVKEAQRKADFKMDYREEQEELMSLLVERFVVAAERIADALEGRLALSQGAEH